MGEGGVELDRIRCMRTEVMFGGAAQQDKRES